MTGTTWALALALAVASPAEDAAALVDEGRSHWERKEFVAAADAFEQAYALDPQPDYLFARAQALRLGGQCGDAIDVYLRFIETGPPEDEVVEAKLRMAECQQVLADEPEPPPPAEAEGAVVTSPPPPASPALTAADDGEPRLPPKRQTDPAGAVLVTTGSVLAAVGIGLLIGGSQVAAGAGDASTELAYGDSFTRARRLSVAGISLASVGGALLLGGIIRYAIVARQRRGGGVAMTRRR